MLFTPPYNLPSTNVRAFATPAADAWANIKLLLVQRLMQHLLQFSPVNA
jgi:hypothetical protein